MVRLSIALTVALLAAAARADDRPYAFREKRLANGLRVVTMERRSCPIVAVQLWYHVGSKDDPPDRQGFAHLFEHMMFRGTDRLGPSEHADLIQAVGGTANAYTNMDATCFVNELPGNQLELALWLEAERMAFLRIDERSFRTERKVVEEERLQWLNAPYGLVYENVLAAVFREHPYRWATIGSIPHLRAASLEEVEAFWAKYYVPCNAALVIVGDVEHERAQLLAERYFGWIPSGSPVARKRAAEPAQQEPRDARIREAHGGLPMAAVVVRTVPFDHPDVVPLRLLTWILAGRRPSRLYTDIMWERPLAHNCYPYLTMEMEDDGLAGVAAQVKSAADQGEVMEAIEAQLDRLRAEPVRSDELEGARRWHRGQEAEACASVSTAASRLGYAAIVGDTERVNRILEDTARATEADLLRAARTNLAPARRTRIRVEPGGRATVEQAGPEPERPDDPERVARRTGAKAGLRRPATFPEKAPVKPPLSVLPVLPQDRRRLANGLEVVVVERPQAPLASCWLSFPFGSASEEKVGAAYFTLSMLVRANQRRDSTAFLAACEKEGLAFRGEADHDNSYVSARCFPDQIDQVLALLGEMVRFPGFEEEDLRLGREMTTRWLSSAREGAQQSAEAVFRRHLYGTHPYGRAPTGEVADIMRLSPGDLRDWWTRFGRPDTAILYVAGAVDADAVFRSAEAHLGAWKAEGAPPVPVPAQLPDPGRRRIVLVNRPGSVQSEIRIGHVSLTRSDPDWAASILMRVILGDSPTSRLNRTLRERLGLTYHAGAGFEAMRRCGTFVVRTSTETTKTADTVRLVLDVLERLREDGPTAEEVAAARMLVAGGLAGRWETADAVLSDIWMVDSMGLGADHFQRALRAHAEATPESLRRIARAHIDPESLLIVVVGDAARVHDGLRRIAPVTVQ